MKLSFALPILLAVSALGFAAPIHAVRVTPAYCTANCGTNNSATAPFYTTQQFWGEIGAGVITAGIVGLLLVVTVYKHLWLGVGSIGLIAAGALIAVYL